MYHFKVPYGPVLFVDKQITDDEYVTCVAEGYPPLLYNMKAHAITDTQEVYDYVKSPVANSGNFRRYDWITKPAASTGPSVSPQGTYQLAKFGCKVDIRKFVNSYSEKEIMYSVLARKENTWSSYLTSWRSFLHFCAIELIPTSVPISTEHLVEYVIFLRENRCLEVSSIRNYLSGIRMLHKLNDACEDNLDSPRISLVLDGMENVLTVHKINPFTSSKSLQRNVLTWNHLQVLGHYLFESNCYDDYNKQVIWTACLIGFFGCFRLGEILYSTMKSYDMISDFTWNKIHFKSPDHYLIVNTLPKCSEDPRGDNVDLFNFEFDDRFCPIYNINKLMDMSPFSLSDHDPVFRFNNGDLFTPSKMNAILKQYLLPVFPRASFTCHSFRAGLASLIAAFPQYFSANDARLVGRWRSDAVERYQRQRGVANKAAFKRVKRFLRHH